VLLETSSHLSGLLVGEPQGFSLTKRRHHKNT
jgi:hypothetical protein